MKIVGNCLANLGYILKSKILGNHRPPSVGSELNHSKIPPSCLFPICVLGFARNQPIDPADIFNGNQTQKFLIFNYRDCPQARHL